MLRRQFIVLFSLLQLQVDLRETHGGHVVSVTNTGGLDVDLLRDTLSVMATSKVLELSQDFDHGNETSRGDVLGVVLAEGFGEAGTVVQLVTFISIRGLIFMLRLVL